MTFQMELCYEPQHSDYEGVLQNKKGKRKKNIGKTTSIAKYILETVYQYLRMINVRFATISRHIFGNYINRFLCNFSI